MKNWIILICLFTNSNISTNDEDIRIYVYGTKKGQGHAKIGDRNYNIRKNGQKF